MSHPGTLCITFNHHKNSMHYVLLFYRPGEKGHDRLSNLFKCHPDTKCSKLDLNPVWFHSPCCLILVLWLEVSGLAFWCYLWLSLTLYWMMMRHFWAISNNSNLGLQQENLYNQATNFIHSAKILNHTKPIFFSKNNCKKCWNTGKSKDLSVNVELFHHFKGHSW